MKTDAGKRLFCCLLAALSVLCCVPLQSTAEGPSGTVAFSTLEELSGFCDEAADFSGSILVCEEADLVISDNFAISPGRTVVLRHFTVPEGITLTVTEGAEVMTYGLTVQGELINYGTVFQGDLPADAGVQEAEIAARIPGKVINKGEMTLTDVFGQRNIQRGRNFTIIETNSYDSKLKAEAQKDRPQPTASPTPEVPPTPETTLQPAPSDELRRQVLKFFDQLEVILPRLAFFFVLVCAGLVIKTALAMKKQEKAAKNASSPSETPYRTASEKTSPFVQERINLDTRGEAHFQRDREKRMSQLDDWLSSGIIDRKEYNELKKRYKQNI